MGRKKPKQMEDFKQIKIKVGKKLPKNTNITKPNFKSGSIVIRPQTTFDDIENVDEAKLTNYKSLLKQLSYQNCKKQSDAANKIRSLLMADNNFNFLYNETIIELMKNYATTNTKTNKAMLNLTDCLLSKFDIKDLKPHITNRIWLSISIGLTDILTIKQKCSLKLLWKVIDRFPLLFLEQIKGSLFFLELFTLSENINPNRMDLLIRINLILSTFVDSKDNNDWYLTTHKFITEESNHFQEFSTKLLKLIKSVILYDTDYINNIDKHFEMAPYKIQQEIITNMNNIKIGLSVLKNMLTFIDKFYHHCSQLKENIKTSLYPIFESQIIINTKNILPIFDATNIKLRDNVDTINLIYCDVICGLFPQISSTNSPLIVARILDYLIGLFQPSKLLKERINVIDKGTPIIDKLFSLYFIEQKFYTGKMIHLMMLLLDCDFIVDIKDDSLLKLIQTVIIVVKNIDFLKIKRHLSDIKECISKFVYTLEKTKMKQHQMIHLLDLVYYCHLKFPLEYNTQEQLPNTFNSLAIKIAGDMKNIDIFNIAMNFISSKEDTVVKFFLKYCINYMFTTSTLTSTQIIANTNAILDRLQHNDTNPSYTASFMYTCSIGFTSNEIVKINEIIQNNHAYFKAKTSTILIPAEMILNDPYFECLDTRVFLIQRLFILLSVFEKIQSNTTLLDIYLDSVQHKVKQWLLENQHSNHINLVVSFLKINQHGKDNMNSWSKQSLQLFVNFLTEFNISDIGALDPSLNNSTINLISILQGILLPNYELGVPQQFIDYLADELDGIISLDGSDDDGDRLDCLFYNLLSIYGNHVFPSYLKEMLSQKLKGLELKTKNFQLMLDKIV